MNNGEQIVLTKLRRARGKGITHSDFIAGFALRSRIADLRAKGFNIQTTLEKNYRNNGRHAVYKLIKENNNG